MIPVRSPLLLASALLALTACGDKQDEADKERKSAPPLGFELAMASTGAAAAEPAVSAASSMIDLSPAEVAARLRDGKLRLIDVRTDEEVAEGAIPGAEHIPLDRFDPALLESDDGREVVLYCRSGRRSEIAGEQLAAFTGKPVAHLVGSILAWEEAGEAITTER